MHAAISRTLELSKLRGSGLAVAIGRPKLFADLYQALWRMQALRPGVQHELERCLASNDPEGVCAVIAEMGRFRRPATWALFWALTEACQEMAGSGHWASHEPELNGLFMGLIAKAIQQFPAADGSNCAVVIGDHATLNNEARSGADFGLVLEIEHRGRIRHLVTLLQAKKATRRIVDVRRKAGDSTQLPRLVSSGIG